LEEIAPKRRRRLQRDQDFAGSRLTTFRQVFLRHGLPGLALALVCLTLPNLQVLFGDVLAKGSARPGAYAAVFVGILLLMIAYTWRRERTLSASRLGWILYLGALSFWEEWVFRVVLPNVLEAQGLPIWSAVFLSALAFSAAHYFTLRWKWRWCLGAFFGSLALSAQLASQSDLLLITAFHWIGTFLNTPKPPGTSSDGPE